MRRIATAVALGLLAAVGLAPTAAAHPTLVQSAPPSGIVAPRAPQQITLGFTEAVVARGSSVRVSDRAGRPVGVGPLRVTDRGSVVTVPLERRLPLGVYSVRWVALGQDGHTTAGTVRFGVAGRGGAPPPGAERLGLDAGRGGEAAQEEGPLSIAVRWLGLLAAAFLVGGWVLVRRLGASPPARWQRLSVVAWAVATGAALWSVISVAGSGASRGLDADLLVASTTGLLALARFFVLAVVGVGAVRLLVARPQARAAVLAATAVVALVTDALDGHVLVGSERSLAAVESVAHVLAAGVWAGGLVAILLLAVPVRAALRAFALPAAVAMGVLVVTGVLSAIREVDRWYFLFWTGYGRVVLLKAGLVVLVLALAGLALRRRSVSVVRVEAVVALVVVGLAATLAGLLQGRGQPLPAQRGSLFATAGLAAATANGDVVRLSVAPARPGVNTVAALPEPGDGRRSPRSVAVRLTCACAREPVAATLRAPRGDGAWSGRIHFPAAGTWYAYVAVDRASGVAPVSFTVGVPKAPGADPVHVVQTADLTGADAERCRANVQGLGLAVAKLNALGGVDGGRKLAVDVFDDGGNAARAEALVARAGGAAVVSPCGAGADGAVAAAAGRVPVLATDPGAAVTRGTRVFRQAGDPWAEGVALSQYVVRQTLPVRAGSPRRVAAISTPGPDSRDRIAGLRDGLRRAGVSVRVLPAAVSGDAERLHAAIDPRRYLATLLDGEPDRLAATLHAIGDRHRQLVPDALFAASPLMTERFETAAGVLGRIGGISSASEVSPASRDGLTYANAVTALFPGDRPSIAGLRGYVAGLALAQAVKDGTSADAMTRRLRRPPPFTDALLAPWRSDRPASGAQRFAIYAARFLPNNLIPTSVTGEARTGRYFRTGDWSLRSGQAYGPLLQPSRGSDPPEGG